MTVPWTGDLDDGTVSDDLMAAFFRWLMSAMGGPGPGSDEAARDLEARGDLAGATAAYLAAGAGDEALRVLSARVDVARTVDERLMLLAQASSLVAAREGRGPLARGHGDLGASLRRRHDALVLDLAEAGDLELPKGEARALAERLSLRADALLAARAHQLAGDVDAAAEALVAAGEVEAVEALLDARLDRDRASAALARSLAEVRDLLACGERRRALTVLEGLGPDGMDAARPLLDRWRRRRVATAASTTLVLQREAVEVAFGPEVVVGRVGTAITVPSPAVSRQHVALRREGAAVVVVDLGSSNGTYLSGARLDVPVEVPEVGALRLHLGRELPATFSRKDGGVVLELPSRRVVVPLGPLQVAGHRLAPGDDGWLELTVGTATAFLRHEGAPVPTGPAVQLCRGDVLLGDDGVFLEVPEEAEP